MATEVKIKGIQGIQDSLIKILKDAERDQQMLSDVGKKAVTYIQGNVRAGRSDYKTAEVSSSTMKRREELKRFNAVDDTYKKKKALDFTGEWIDSLTFTVTTDSVDLNFAGTHKPYKNSKGKDIGGGVKNAEIYLKMAALNRDILFLSDKLKNLLSIEIVRNVRRRIKLYKALSKTLKKQNGD